MAQMIKYKGQMYQRVDSDKATAMNLTVALIKDVESMTKKIHQTLEASKKVERYLNEALAALKNDDIKKAQGALTLASTNNENFTNGASLVIGISHAINALK